MARASSTDFLHNFNFSVTATDILGGQPLQADETGGRPTAGFMTCSTPELRTDTASYREGTWIYTQKQMGIPAMSDIQLTRGVTRNDNSLYTWMLQGVEGSGEYRVDLTINQLDRSVYPGTPGNSSRPATPYIPAASTSNFAKQYILHEAFPVSTKIASDLTATNSEISVTAITVSYEWFEVNNPPAPTT